MVLDARAHTHIHINNTYICIHYIYVCVYINLNTELGRRRRSSAVPGWRGDRM